MKSDYTVQELKRLAVTIAQNAVRDWRNESTDADGWNHYDAILADLNALMDELKD